MSSPILIHPTVLQRPSRIARLELLTGLRALWIGRLAVLRSHPCRPRVDDPDFALSDYVGDPEPPKGVA